LGVGGGGLAGHSNGAFPPAPKEIGGSVKAPAPVKSRRTPGRLWTGGLFFLSCLIRGLEG